jgi:hypothetical protein
MFFTCHQVDMTMTVEGGQSGHNRSDPIRSENLSSGRKPQGSLNRLSEALDALCEGVASK